MLLQGVEAGYNGEHVNVLSAGRRYKGVPTADLRDVDEQSLMLANMFPATTPLHHRNDSRKPEQGVGPESATACRRCKRSRSSTVRRADSRRADATARGSSISPTA